MCDCETNQKCLFFATWKERTPKWPTWWKGFDLGPAGCSKICVKVWGMCGGSMSQRAGILFSKHTDSFPLCAPAIYFVCDQPGPLTLCSFGSRTFTVLRILLSDNVVTFLWQTQQTTKMPHCFSSVWKAEKGILQVARPSRSPVLHGLRMVWCFQRVQWTFNHEMPNIF